MLDLFCVRPTRHITAGISEKQAFIGEKQSIYFIKTESTLSVVGIISAPFTEMSSFIQCNNDFFTVKTSLEIQLIFTIRETLEKLKLDNSWCYGSNIFLFGSVFSLLNTPSSLFEDLATMIPNIYINVGLESADQETLDRLGKPLTSQMIIEAFDLIQDINGRYQNIEITSNFVTDDTLNTNHYQMLISLIRDRISKPKSKGCIYLSPLQFGSPCRAQLFKFYRLKVQSRLPLFLYTIQKL